MGGRRTDVSYKQRDMREDSQPQSPRSRNRHCLYRRTSTPEDSGLIPLTHPWPTARMEADAGSGNQGGQSPSNSQQTVSDDDEIDYSIKPEFYDPNLDDEDESWVEKKRHGNITDAVLSCPACFTTLCLECQRHEKYETQYRAIFVVNCKVKTQDVLYQQSRARPGRAKRRRDTAEHGGREEVGAVGRGSFKHVCCSVCSTEVGVIDEEEVYHFYDVLPSEA